MVWRLRICTVVVALGMGAVPLVAEEHSASELGFWSPHGCLLVNDYAFEHSLQEGLAEADRIALTNVFATATYECLGLAMEICEGQDDSIACLGELSGWVRNARVTIVARLPAEIEFENALSARRYARRLESAAAAADEAACDHLDEAERVRYCEVLSEGVALEDAYHVWRMARREGAVALEGHPLVDLELIR